MEESISFAYQISIHDTRRASICEARLMAGSDVNNDVARAPKHGILGICRYGELDLKLGLELDA